MARRASKSGKAGGLIGIGVAVLVALLGISYFAKNKGSSSSNDLQVLDVMDAVEDANSLRGNEYQVSGTVHQKETRDRGSLVFLRVEVNGSSEFLPIKVPNGLETVNIEREKDYNFSVIFEKEGVAKATAVEKL